MADDLTSTLAADPSAYGTASDIQRRRQLAHALMTAGGSGAPVQSAWQGAARLAQGLMGGYQAGQLDQEQTAGQAELGANRAKMMGAIVSGQGTTPTPAAASLATALNGDGDSSAPTSTLSSGVTSMLPTFAKVGDGYGVSPDYLARTAQIKSGGNWNARNPSGAAGGFQFMPTTAKAYGLTNPNDPAAATDAAAHLASDNRQSLTASLGRDPTDAELYLAHQQGAGGAAQLLSNPNALASDVVGRAAVVQNGGSPGMTAGQFAGLWTGKYNRTPGAQVASANPAQTANPGSLSDVSPMAYAGPQGGAFASSAISDAINPNVVGARDAAAKAALPDAASPYTRATFAGPPTATAPMVATSDTATGGDVQGTGVPGAKRPVTTDYDPAYTDDDDTTPRPSPRAVPSARVLRQRRRSRRSVPCSRAVSLPTLCAPPWHRFRTHASAADQSLSKIILEKAFAKPDGPISVAKGTVLLDPVTRQPIYSNKDDAKDDRTTEQKNYEYYVTQAKAGGQAPMPFDTWATAKARAAATNVNMNVDTKAGDTYDQQLAQGLGKAHAGLANGVEDAQARSRDLAAMQNAVDAIRQNGGTTGGLGASQVLDLQKTINSGANALGFDKPFDEIDLSDKEFMTKFNRQLSGAMAKSAVGGRVTNFEMGNYLKANPGLELSLTGNSRLIGIQSQIEQRNVEVGSAIRNATADAISRGQKINPMAVQKIINDYDNDPGHHIKDPLTGQDLTQNVRLPEFQGGGGGGGTGAPTTPNTGRARLKFNPATGAFE